MAYGSKEFSVIARGFLNEGNRNTLCAKLVCDWTNTRITETRNFDVQYTYLGGSICMSAATRQDSIVTDPDNTYVTDGTICDDQRFCLSGRCAYVADHKNLASCNASKLCNGHGRDRNIDERETLIGCLLHASTGDQAHNQGMCPDLELSW
ncbi:Disintegrin and metalloproteinase domain-containing protein 5 [Myotis davidii]|uniref:Disintegrin and metalloproteinase domain-containing protein 5 n=1 Tax=Myotis davidii TaxID=225400 RepID=L5LS12_MYODS|nr:Disintegrin and metalloproteinase domain-containing protein 5 [Myotis davidii]